MPDSEENKHVEIVEEQVFSGGEITSVEPMADGDTAHGVHGSFHGYSGGQILERTDTIISPWLWFFWGVVLLGIVIIVFGMGFTWLLSPVTHAYDRPEGLTLAGYQAAASAMSKQASPVVMTSPDTIDMYELPRPQGQDLTGAIAAGTTVYTTYCVGCHGPNQDGNGPNSVALDPKPRNLRDQPFMQAISYQREWTSVHKGVPGTAMPRWENVISDSQIQDVICYVFSLTAPTDPKTGDFIRPSPQVLAGSSPASPANLGATTNVH